MRTPRLLICLFVLLTAGRLFAAEPGAIAALDRVEKALQPVLEKLDPKPEVTRVDNGNSLQAGYKTLTYTVHGRNKTGEVSPEASYVVGPGNGGFILRVHVEKAGLPHQAETPQTHKEPYWQTYLDITPLEGTQKQLYWSLSYSGKTDRDLLAQIRQKLGDLDGKADKAEKPGLW